MCLCGLLESFYATYLVVWYALNTLDLHCLFIKASQPLSKKIGLRAVILVGLNRKRKKIEGAWDTTHTLK